MSGDRGQLVLAAAAVVAIALAPVVLAYLQLGYAADVQAGGEYDAPAADTVRALERAVHAASADAATTERGPRGSTAEAVRAALQPRLRTIEGTRVDRGTAVRLTYNHTTATGWADSECRRGDGRRFGPCRADRGVVVQSRAGESTVLAVAFDVTVTTGRGVTKLTVVVRPV